MMLSQLPEAGARVRTEVIPSNHPLISLIDRNDEAGVQRQLQVGHSPLARIQDARGESLLERSMVKGSERVFAVLLSEIKEHDALALLVDSRGTPLLLSMTNLAIPGRPMTSIYEREIIALLDAFPELLKESDHAYVGDGRQPLHGAAAIGNLKLAQEFVGRGAAPDVKNAPGETPLHLAARFGHLQVVRFLVSSGAKLDEVTRYTHATPLMCASEAGHDSVIRFLLMSGASKGTQDAFGKTAHQRYKEFLLAFKSSKGMRR